MGRRRIRARQAAKAACDEGYTCGKEEWEITEVSRRVNHILRRLFLFGLLATCAFGQDLRNDSFAVGPKGLIARATVAVCSQPANTSRRLCPSLAHLCSGLADVVCSSPSPIMADQLGNYHFYMNPSQEPMTVQIYGSQEAALFVLQDQFVASQLTGPNAWTGANTFAGPLSESASNTGNVASKPASADATVYVSPNGSDSNDGLS